MASIEALPCILVIGLQFAIVEVVVTSIQDGFPRWIKRHLGYHEIVVLFVCLISFLFGLPNLIQVNTNPTYSVLCSGTTYHGFMIMIWFVNHALIHLPFLLLFKSGIYYFQLMDHYTASVTIMFLAFCQMIAIAWFYNIERLSKNVKQMTGKAPSLYLKSCWVMFGPCLLFVSNTVYTYINYTVLNYSFYLYLLLGHLDSQSNQLRGAKLP